MFRGRVRHVHFEDEQPHSLHGPGTRPLPICGDLQPDGGSVPKTDCRGVTADSQLLWAIGHTNQAGGGAGAEPPISIAEDAFHLVPPVQEVCFVAGHGHVDNVIPITGIEFASIRGRQEVVHPALIGGGVAAGAGQGFIGGARNRPAPISEAEVAKIVNQMQEGVDKPRPKVEWIVGELVRVKEGPFTDFNGAVEEVNYEKSKVKVSVTIFGRATGVELDFAQVEKV